MEEKVNRCGYDDRKCFRALFGQQTKLLLFDLVFIFAINSMASAPPSPHVCVCELTLCCDCEWHRDSCSLVLFLSISLHVAVAYDGRVM